jgi:hypothetical protein
VPADLFVPAIQDLSDKSCLASRIRFPVTAASISKRLLQFSVTPTDVRIVAQSLAKLYVVQPLTVRRLHDVKVDSPYVGFRFLDKEIAAFRAGIAAVDVTASPKTLYDRPNRGPRRDSNGNIQNRFRGNVGNRGAADVLDIDSDVADTVPDFRSFKLECRRPFGSVIDNPNRVPPEAEITHVCTTGC